MNNENLFAGLLKLNEAYWDFSKWDSKVQAIFAQHAEYLKNGMKEGRVHIVGRTDSTPQANMGIAIFRAANQAEAETFAKNDPVVKSGIMAVTVQPFKLFVVTEEARKMNIW